jgi:hypothetical protein
MQFVSPLCIVLCCIGIVSAELDFITVRLPLLVSDCQCDFFARAFGERTDRTRYLRVQGQRSAPNAVWPHPQQITLSNDTLFIRPRDLMVYSNMESCDIIARAIERYQPLFFPPKLDMQQPPADGDKVLQSLTLTLRGDTQCPKYIQLDSDESCE